MQQKQTISIKDQRKFINQNVVARSDLKDHQKRSKRPTVAEIIVSIHQDNN